MTNSKIFGIIALKGGVGKTTLAANIGASLSRDFQKKVLIIDANFSTPHLGLHLGIVNPKYTLHHVLNDNHSIIESIYQHELGFHVIPGMLSPFKIDPMILKERLGPLRGVYDVILIDSSPSLNDEMFATINASDELLVVSSPDYPTLSSTLHAINVAKEKNANIRGIIINRAHKKRFELTRKDIEGASNTKILAVIPHNIKVLSALSKMRPVVDYFPRQDVSLSIRDLAGSLVGERKKRNIFGNKKTVPIENKEIEAE